MTNWEIRDIRRALGGTPKSRGRKSQPIQKAVTHLIKHSTEPVVARKAFLNDKAVNIIEKSKTICREFKDIYNAEKDANQPLILAKEAKTKLEVVKEALKNFKKLEDLPFITKELIQIKKIVRSCIGAAKLPKYRVKK